MILGWFVAINLVSFIFLAEANLLGKSSPKIPGVIAIARLSLIRKTRAFRMYLHFLVLCAVTAIFPAKSLALIVVTPNVMILVWVGQITIWSVLLAINHVRCGHRI